MSGISTERALAPGMPLTILVRSASSPAGLQSYCHLCLLTFALSVQQYSCPCVWLPQACSESSFANLYQGGVGRGNHPKWSNVAVFREFLGGQRAGLENRHDEGSVSMVSGAVAGAVEAI